MKKLPSGASLDVFETLDSTSAEAKRRARDGARGPSWIVALQQTAGYGRRGRAWTQDSGDFAGSLLFTTDAPKDLLGQLSFVAALAVHDAVAGLVATGDVRIKWPNDILIDKAKVSGLLLEMVDPGAAPALVFGVGVNMISKPEDTAYPTARLLDHGLAAPVAPADFAALVDAAFWAAHGLWRAQGFAPIRDMWLARAAGRGEAMTARLPDETVSGVFEGLDPAGGLILRIEGGTRIINAGDVYFGAAPDRG